MSCERFSNVHLNEGFLCPFCDEYLPTSEHMRTHLVSCGSKTNECPFCNKYIPRMILAYHVNHNCHNPNPFEEREASAPINHLNSHINSSSQRSCDMNASSDQVESKSPKKFQPLYEKATHVQETLAEYYYEPEVNHVREKLQFNIIIMGSPRVGKSALINVLCNGKNRAETSPSLNSCTKEVTCYVLEDNQQPTPNVKPFRINFYDTPGIESWKDGFGQDTMIKIIEETNPLCFIFCASPGTFADLKQLRPVLQYCKTKDIFCALVCTNMWSGNSRDNVIKEFEEQLQFFGNKIEKFSEQLHSPNPHKVTFFGKDALCTMVNSLEYYDPDLSDQRKPVQGIDELIHGIMEALDHEKLLGWCYAVLYRRTYWEKISQQISGFFSLHLKSLHQLVTSSPDKTATNFLTYLNEFIFQKKT
ncbi:unnamed protein product [Rotaria sp. Silwood2]|nr:unnamed protein product [Rotaria sp. Silwood2]CAF3050105.1 unnamed protein product [Rotaria sp. Silwood2]CAF3331916.1 unnamed protein product [Rotaria sp. Silwood2]CAF3891575.1 unnamed protein product [Rotaria sp. Silwood2]CAF4364276.1 unnamed protein product [Rotaria sp. Silwood2]